MLIRVKLFATLVQHRPGTQAGVPFTWEAPADASVGDLIAHLGLPAAEVKVVFVNGRARPLTWVLHDNDEVGIFPPIGGG